MTLNLLAILGKSLMYIQDNKGLKIEPCGTPVWILDKLEIE